MDRSKIIVRTSIFGIGVNAAMVLLKMAVGFLTGSIAIILDAVNNLSDALSSIITIIGTKLADRAPDKKFPYGHGRVEYLTTVIVSFVILIAGGTSFKESIENIINKETATYSLVTVLLIAVAVVVKFFAGRYVKSVGRKVQSGALVASGREAIFDAVLSFATIIAAVVSVCFHVSIEGFVGLAISLLIIRGGALMLSETVGAIVGKRADRTLTNQLRSTVREFSEVLGAYDIVLHNYGPTRHMGSVHIEVDEDMDARAVHLLTQRIMAKVYKEMGIMITIGIYSSNNKDPKAIAMKEEVAKAIKEYHEILQFHGFYLDKNIVGFDIVVDFKSDANKIRRDLATRLSALHPEYEFRIVLDLDFSD